MIAAEESPGSVIAVDWSGAADERSQRRKIWLAEARAGRLVRLECGATREAWVERLAARAGESLVVGLDFAFSFPAWFARERGGRTGPDVWALAAEQGEPWLGACPPPFWGRPRRARPASVDGASAYRRTESRARVGGIAPKSVFQVGGAGAVGTGSLRGMRHLLRLQSAGFAIWPFDAPRLPLVLEIYPRYLTGAVNKASAGARSLRIERARERMSAAQARDCERSEDAFDAALSALAMWDAREEFGALRRAPAGSPESLEGEIWVPRRDAFAASFGGVPERSD